MPVQVFSLSGSNVNKSERDKHLVFLVRGSCACLYKYLFFLDQNFLYKRSAEN